MRRPLVRLVLVVLWSPQAAGAPDAFANLLDWLQVGIDEAGLGSRHAPLKDTFELLQGPFGKSLVMKRRVEENTTLAILPTSRLVIGEAEGQTMVWLAKERKRWQAGQESKYAPYLAVLPEDHKHLPKSWDPAFFRQHLNGSFFPDYVNEMKSVEVAEFERQNGNQLEITKPEFEFARDIVATRAMGTGDERKDERLLFPLFDLALHDDKRNILCEFDMELKQLNVRSTRRILAGEQVSNSYYENTTSSWTSLQNWGFTTDQATHQVRLSVTAEEAAAAQERVLGSGRDLQTGPALIDKLTKSFKGFEATVFMNYLRGLADGGQLDDTGAISKSVTTWGVEILALRIGQAIVETALARYPESLAEDEAALAQKLPDQRVRFMIMIRRDEKMVLHWWLRLFGRAIQQAPHEKEEAVDEAYLEHASESDMERYQRAVFKFLKSLEHDVMEASQQPAEFGLVAGAILVGLEVLFWGCSRCAGGVPRELLRGWVSRTLAITAYAAVAATSTWDMINHVLKYQMTLVWVCALSLYLGSQLLAAAVLRVLAALGGQ